MATLLLDSETIPTVRDLLRGLGGIPAERVLMHPQPGEATEADLIRLLDGEPKKLCELIDGTLVEKAVGMAESLIGSRLGYELRGFGLKHDLGEPCGADGPVRVLAGNVRLPNISFFLYDNVPNGMIPTDSICDLVPDLAVEVMSKSNTQAEIRRKRLELFNSGTRLFWEIDPRKKTVAVYTSPTDKTLLKEGDTLTGGSVLPGFEIALAYLFAKPGRRGKLA